MNRSLSVQTAWATTNRPDQQKPVKHHTCRGRNASPQSPLARLGFLRHINGLVKALRNAALFAQNTGHHVTSEKNIFDTTTMRTSTDHSAFSTKRLNWIIYTAF